MGKYTDEQMTAVKAYHELLKDRAVATGFDTPAAMSILDATLEEFNQDPVSQEAVMYATLVSHQPANYHWSEAVRRDRERMLAVAFDAGRNAVAPVTVTVPDHQTTSS